MRDKGRDGLTATKGGREGEIDKNSDRGSEG